MLPLEYLVSLSTVARPFGELTERRYGEYLPVAPFRHDDANWQRADRNTLVIWGDREASVFAEHATNESQT